jgi:hypothetical protein
MKTTRNIKAYYSESGPIDLGKVNNNIKNGEGEYSIAGGIGATTGAGAPGSLAFGEGAQTSSKCSSAFGYKTSTGVNGIYAAAFGVWSKANAKGSFAAGNETIATRDYQAVFGQRNLENADALFIVGSGQSTRRNALEVLWNGKVKVYNPPEDDEDVVRLLELKKKIDTVKIANIYGTVVDTYDIKNGTLVLSHAKSGKAGIVRTSDYYNAYEYGISTSYEGYLFNRSPSDDAIANRNTSGEGVQSYAVTLGVLDKAVRQSMLTNGYGFNEEQQKTVQDWLGVTNALSKKADKTTIFTKTEVNSQIEELSTEVNSQIEELKDIKTGSGSASRSTHSQPDSLPKITSQFVKYRIEPDGFKTVYGTVRWEGTSSVDSVGIDINFGINFEDTNYGVSTTVIRPTKVNYHIVGVYDFERATDRITILLQNVNGSSAHDGISFIIQGY